MSNSDKYGIDNERPIRRSSINVPSHGTIPKWLKDMSTNVISSRSADRKHPPHETYNLVDLNTLKDGSDIPSSLSNHIRLNENEKHLNTLVNKFERSERSSSVTAQFDFKNFPKYSMPSESDYFFPQLDSTLNLSDPKKDLLQEELERSWKGLKEFQQTHKGRLDSANNALSDISSDNYHLHSSLLTYPASDESTSYSPSFLTKHTLPVRSKSEMSNYVPYYVYSKIKKATESDDTTPSTRKSSLELIETFSNSKAKSSEDIYNYFSAGSKRSILNSEKHLQRTLADVQNSELSFNRQSIDKHLSDYRLKLDQENLFRERIINELLTENERIVGKLKNQGAKKKLNKEKVGLTKPLTQQLYDKNSKYKSSQLSKFSLHKEEDNWEKDNLIERHIEGSDCTFAIPYHLPTGKVLEVDILSTWGDKHYVGLNGIEIFTDIGKIVDVNRITASPADINVLPENHNAPRVVTNLLDGVNRTQDDVHLWLAPFDDRSKHTITIEFKNVSTLAMIRIWNYNKSRIHSFRGVRDIILRLDGVAIFKGEIAKASGGVMGGVDAFGDTILLTTDDNILELISKNDKSFSTLTTTVKVESPILERPPTVATMNDRPFTGALQVQQTPITKDQILLGTQRLDIVLLSNWGYADIIGLTGLEVFGVSENGITINEENISCGFKMKNFNLKALINRVNITTDINNMWWCSYRNGFEVPITIQFPDFTYVSGLRVWNYNQSTETSYAGVQAITILLDKKPLINPLSGDELFLLRRAPGNVHYDFVQEIRFVDTNASTTVQHNSLFSSTNPSRNEMPEGFVFQLIVFSTWGDQYYCGLNGIELYNQFNKRIVLEEQNICAYPDSINVLPRVNGDTRTPDKLIDGINADDEGAHSWLAPIIPKCLNRIYIILDQPTTVSLIKLWNYSKTPSRGIKEFGVLVDDLLVYNGILDKNTKKHAGPTYQSIVFTNNKRVLESENNTYIRHSSYSQELIFFDENRTTTGGSLHKPNQKLRPFTSVSPFDKGYNSH